MGDYSVSGSTALTFNYAGRTNTYDVVRETEQGDEMKKADIDRELDEFGRFSEPALLILISLADGPKHGYAMTEDIARIADLRLGPGTLYGAISRLEARGMIEAVGAEDRRNPYRITAFGEKALRTRLASIQNVARIGQRRLASA